MKITKQEKKVLENYFGVDIYDNTLELEQWTNGGVDMIIEIDLEDNENSLSDELRIYIDNFDIDEEIELYRESKDYRDNFTIRESLEDFETWLEYCENCYKELLKLEREGN